MPVTHIPGRRLSDKESFYTDWTRRGGDSMMLRAEMIIQDASSDLIIVVETRKEAGDTPTTVNSTHPGASFTLSSIGVATAYYNESLQAEVRLKVTCAKGYNVSRIFPPVFFDNAK